MLRHSLAVSGLAQVKTNPPLPMFSPRALVLAVAFTAFVSVLLNADLGGRNSYSTSYDSRIGLYGGKLDSLTRISSWPKRLFMRHVANYEIPSYLAPRLLPGDTLLLPPMSYANQYMRHNATWTDPRIFTWMVGFHPIIAWSDSGRRNLANAFVVLDVNQVWIARLGGRTNIDSLLNVYQESGQ